METQPSITRQSIEDLLRGFAAISIESLSVEHNDVHLLHEFLHAFTQIRQRTEQKKAQDASSQLVAIQALFKNFAQAETEWVKAERSRASTFSILSALGLTDKELKHSNALAWLLSRDIYAPGSHAQGSLGFHIFLDHFGWPPEWAADPYVVRRECAGEKSRIDIEIAMYRKFVIHIENKIWSPEGEGQLENQFEDLEKRKHQLQAKGSFAIYLTPTGEKASHPKFLSLSWSQVANMFEQFAGQVDPGAKIVSMFANHYAAVVRQTIANSISTKEMCDEPERI